MELLRFLQTMGKGGAEAEYALEQCCLDEGVLRVLCPGVEVVPGILVGMAKKKKNSESIVKDG